MSAGYSGTTLNSFVHGSWHSDLKAPFRLNAWLTNNAPNGGPSQFGF
jgi:hypothetical protein